MKQIYSLSLLALLLLHALTGLGQKTQIANVRTNLDQRTFDLVVQYDLISLRPGDSLAVRFMADGKRLRARTVTGDIGYNIPVGKNHQVRWNMLRDNVSGNADIVAEVVGIHPGLLSGPRGRVRLLGLASTVGLGVYSTLLAGKITDDVRRYNAAPDPVSLQNDQSLATLKKEISGRKTLFFGAVGLATALLVANAVYTLKPSRSRAYTLRVGALPVGLGASVAVQIR